MIMHFICHCRCLIWPQKLRKKCKICWYLWLLRPPVANDGAEVSRPITIFTPHSIIPYCSPNQIAKPNKKSSQILWWSLSWSFFKHVFFYKTFLGEVLYPNILQNPSNPWLSVPPLPHVGDCVGKLFWPSVQERASPSANRTNSLFPSLSICLEYRPPPLHPRDCRFWRNSKLYRFSVD